MNPPNIAQTKYTILLDNPRKVKFLLCLSFTSGILILEKRLYLQSIWTSLESIKLMGHLLDNQRWVWRIV